MSILKTPSWTVLYSIESSDHYVSRVKEFFDEKKEAEIRYVNLSNTDKRTGSNHVPTLRPFDSSDISLLEYHKSEI